MLYKYSNYVCNVFNNIIIDIRDIPRRYQWMPEAFSFGVFKSFHLHKIPYNFGSALKVSAIQSKLISLNKLPDPGVMQITLK